MQMEFVLRYQGLISPLFLALLLLLAPRMLHERIQKDIFGLLDDSFALKIDIHHEYGRPKLLSIELYLHQANTESRKRANGARTGVRRPGGSVVPNPGFK